MVKTFYIEPETLVKYSTLPKNWRNKVSPMSEEYALSHGWQKITIDVPAPVKPITYSKLKLMRAMKEQGIWAEVKEYLELLGIYDEWLVAQDLSSTDPVFSSFIDQMQVKYGSDTVALMLEKAVV